MNSNRVRASWCNGCVRRVHRPHDDISQTSPALDTLARARASRTQAQLHKTNTEWEVGRMRVGMDYKMMVGEYGIGYPNSVI